MKTNNKTESFETCDYESCWFDDVGDRWEEDGVPACRIFEFHEQIRDDFQPGGMIEATSDQRPSRPLQIKRCLLRTLSGEEVELKITNPLLLAASPLILRNLL